MATITTSSPPELKGWRAQLVSLRALVSLGLVFVAAGLLAGAVASRLEQSMPGWAAMVWRPNYLRSLSDALPEIAARPGRVVVAVGASQSFYAFFPPGFDAAMRESGVEVESYNLAFPAWTSLSVRLWMRRIGDAFDAADRRADVVLLGLSPHLLTGPAVKLRHWQYFNVPDQAKLARLRDAPILLASSLRSTPELLRYRLLGSTPATMRRIMRTHLMDLPPERPFFEEWDLPEGFPQWPADTRGGLTQRSLFESEDDRRALMIRHRDTRMIQSDILELRFHPGAIWHVDRTIAEAKRFAKRVIVMVPPRNHEVLQTRRHGIARLQKMLRIRAKRNEIEVIDFYTQPADFAIGDFMDATHLDGNGARERFSRLLAQQVLERAPELRVDTGLAVVNSHTSGR